MSGVAFMAVSMDDVAQESGVSKATVSRVLSMKGGVAEKSRKKVIDACEKLGYQLNPGIQDLVLKCKSGNTRQLALVMIDEPFNSAPYIQTISNLINATNAHGYHLSFVNIDSKACGSVYDLPAELRDKRVDGMFLLGHFPEKIAAMFLKLGLPGVLIGCFKEKICEGFCNIHSDFYARTKETVLKLKKAGAKRIAYVEEIMHLESEIQIYQAFMKAHHEILGEFCEKVHYVGKIKLAGMLGAMTPIFMKKELPFDGIFCPDERIAIEMDKLNFMHSKLFSVPMIPQATSWLSHDSVLENKIICSRSSDYGDFAVKILESMIEKKPFPRKVIL